jgi:hypothetical protein
VASRSAGGVAMSVDFSKSVASPRLGACQHSIDALKDINFALKRLRRHFIERESPGQSGEEVVDLGLLI